MAFAGEPANTGGLRGLAGGRQPRRGAARCLRFYDSGH